MAPRLSVIIPALNEEANIVRAIESAWRATAEEVVVADGGSDDRTVELAQAHGAMVLSAQRGRAVQQNAGARHATGDVLFFLHADNWLAIGIGHQLRSCLADPRVEAGAFRQKIEAEGVLFRLLEHGNAARVRWRGMPYGDQAIFVRRKLWESLGGFPEVPIMEDVLLMQAIRKQCKPALLPGPVHVDARRWQSRGVVRQTLRNWSLLAAQSVGVSPERLATFYPRHDR